MHITELEKKKLFFTYTIIALPDDFLRTRKSIKEAGIGPCDLSKFTTNKEGPIARVRSWRNNL